MNAKAPREVFFLLLSNLRNNTEIASNIYQEISKVAEEPEVKEALVARAFASQQILAKIDECFHLTGEKPVKTSTHLHDVFAEDFRNELAEIHSPVARHLYVLAKLRHFAHLQMGEYVALIEAADLAGHHGVGLLLETCLADKMAFAERTRRFIRHAVEEKIMESIAVGAR